MATMGSMTAWVMAVVLGAVAAAATGCSSASSGPTSGGGGGTLPGAGGDAGAPTQGGATPQAFCSDLETWLTQCGMAPDPSQNAACVQSYQKYTASQIAASEACLAGCDQTAVSQCLKNAVAGGATTPPPSGGADAGSTGGCQACVDAQCPSQLANCQANPQCVALAQCLQTAQTQQDAQACQNQSPDGVMALQDLLQCAQGPCGSVCK